MLATGLGHFTFYLAIWPQFLQKHWKSYVDSGLPLRSVYRPLGGIPTISVGRYFLTWGKNALIWVKNSQKRGKN